jgi:hypothetical protein
MRRVAINNYKPSPLIYSHGSDNNKDAFVYFMQYMETIEDDNGCYYFTPKSPIKCIPHWDEIDPAHKDEEYAILRDIVDELIPMALFTMERGYFYISIPTDDYIDRMIISVKSDIDDKKAELKKWKKLKIK